jgi:hypothetical protein
LVNYEENQGIQNQKFYFNEKNFEKSFLSSTLRYMNNFVDDGTGRFSNFLNTKFKTLNENEKIEDDIEYFYSSQIFHSQENDQAFSYSGDSSLNRNILNYENQVISNETYTVDLEYGIAVRSDLSDILASSASEFSSEFNVEITPDEENLLHTNIHVQSPNSFSQMVLQNAENYKLLSGNSRKGVRILPIVNFTAAAMAFEEVCVICLGDFDELCPKFTVELQDQLLNDEGIIHKAHNSEWHEECILQWIEVNEKKHKYQIFCPLCQEELKDPRFPTTMHLVLKQNTEWSRILSDLYEFKGILITASFLLIIFIFVLILVNA